MSRYVVKLANGRTVAYGFDRMLGEYFLQEFLSSKERDDNEAYNQNLQETYGNELPEGVNYKSEMVLFSIMSYTTTDPHPDYPDPRKTYSNNEFHELMSKYPEGTFPAEHMNALAADLPF